MSFFDTMKMDEAIRVPYSTPLPLQEECVPAVLEALRDNSTRDILCASPTGSGKTLCYIVPILDFLLRQCAIGTTVGMSRALILAPTATLVKQIIEQVTMVVSPAVIQAIGVLPLYAGGLGHLVEVERLLSARLIVSTPTRFLDHAFLWPRVLVLDEADALMLSPPLLARLQFLDAQKDPGAHDLFGAVQPFYIRKMAFSATLTKDEGVLTRAFGLRRVRTIVGGEDGITLTLPKTLKVTFQIVEKRSRKVAALKDALRRNDGARVLIFVNTVKSCQWLHEKLTACKIEASAFSSAVTLSKRQKAIKQARILVCTDAAARGLDLDDVGLVIHFEHAPLRRTFIHRAGRTARAGKEGESLSILEPKNVHHFKEFTKKEEGVRKRKRSKQLVNTYTKL